MLSKKADLLPETFDDWFCNRDFYHDYPRILFALLQVAHCFPYSHKIIRKNAKQIKGGPENSLLNICYRNRKKITSNNKFDRFEKTEYSKEFSNFKIY